MSFRVKVDVTEWLGNSQYAYVPYDAPADIKASLASLEKELDSEQLRTQMIVSVDAASRIRDGDEAELWLDPSRMQLFDPQSGHNLTLLNEERESAPPSSPTGAPSSAAARAGTTQTLAEDGATRKT